MPATTPGSAPDRTLGLIKGVDKMTLGYLTGAATLRLVQRGYLRLRNEMSYIVTLHGEDEIYVDVHNWLLSQIPMSRQRALTARTHRPITNTRVDESPLAMALLYNGDREQTIHIGGHRVKVVILKEEEGFEFMGDGKRSLRSQKMVFTCFSERARDYLLDTFERITFEKERRSSQVFVATQWNEWERRADLPVRKLETVVLAKGQKEALVHDLSTFLDAEEAYVELGLPWHRGYMLYGPPGTGKTSIARALAEHFRMDVYTLPIGGMSKDTSLIRIISAIRPRSMLLLEDADSIAVAHDRETVESTAGETLTLSGVLNSLDGITTPHGLVTVMTTQRPDVFDEAVTRSGRVDKEVKVGLVDDDQLHRMFCTFFPTTNLSNLQPLGGRRISPATVVGSFKDHLGDGPRAIEAVNALPGRDDASPSSR